MKEKRFYPVFFVIICFLFFSTPKIVLFYDAPEYITIISANSFFKSLSLGHTPIHPVFIGSLWITTRLIKIFLPVSWEYSGNLSVLFFGVTSIVLFYKIARIILNKDFVFTALLIFTLFPAVWIINTNVMVESVALTFYLFALYCLIQYIQKNIWYWKFLYIVSCAFLVGIHIETIIWLSALFSIPFLFRNKLFLLRAKIVKQLCVFTLTGIALGVLLYVLIFLYSGKNVLPELMQSFVGRVNDHYDVTKIGLIRMGRNIVISLFRAFGSLSVLIMVYSIWLKRKDKFYPIGFLILTVVLCVSGAVWTGDFMMRRVIFAGVFIPLIMTTYAKKISVVVIWYLFIITFFNVLLYSPFIQVSGYPLKLLSKIQKRIGGGNIFIYTQYVYPFVHDYNGQIRFIENKIDLSDDVGKGKEVFLDSQAVFAPYILYIGNNFHITSLGRFGISDSRYLFTTYSFNIAKVEDVNKRIYAYSLTDKDVSFEKRLELNRRATDDSTHVIIGKGTAGTPVFIYSKKFFKRIARERIDYGDILTWVWVIVTNRHEPLLWTYADKNGVFVLPVSAGEVQKIDIKGENLTDIHIL